MTTSEDRRSEQLAQLWHPLEDSGRGYLSVYYSEGMARFPVREITRPGDNKSDPNIETGTYGLFSTCEPTMRNRIVNDGAATVFFITTHRRGRVLTGYYHVGWFTEGTQGAINRDFALAARRLRFIAPVPVAELPHPAGELASAQFRTMKPLQPDVVALLRGFCDSQSDETSSYLEEVKRIERFAQAQTGLAYPSWGRQEGFTWSDADDYYQTDADLSQVPNSSKSHKWRCRECDHVIRSAALLKKCPLCKRMATLQPVQES